MKVVDHPLAPLSPILAQDDTGHPTGGGSGRRRAASHVL